MESTPLITIVMPVYNGSKYIAETIKSVLNQSYKNFELFVIDNASTDNTVSIVKMYSDPRIILIQNQENIGFLRNWNLALSLGKGTYFKLLPADDILLKKCLEKQVQSFAIFNEKVSIVCCPRNIIDGQGKNLMVRGFKVKELSYMTSKEAIKKVIRSGANPIGEPGAVLIRRSLINKVGQFNPKNLYTIDLNYWVRCLKYGGLAIQPEPLAEFRLHHHSTSVGLVKEQILQYAQFLAWSKIEFEFLTGFDLAKGRLLSTISTFGRYLIYKFIIRD